MPESLKPIPPPVHEYLHEGRGDSGPAKVEIYDTTLRDGAQSEGITYSVEDKLKVLRALDRLGVHYVEGGWPGSNPKDVEFFERAAREPLATVAASGRRGLPATAEREAIWRR